MTNAVGGGGGEDDDDDDDDDAASVSSREMTPDPSAAAASANPGVVGQCEEADPVIGEIPVFLSKSDNDNLYLFQYPVRPACMPYPREAVQGE